MVVTLKFTNGREAIHNADRAHISGHLLVLSKYNKGRRKHETSEVFQADEIAWARYPDGRIVLGKGTVSGV
jgi:hypothetical protein